MKKLAFLLVVSPALWFYSGKCLAENEVGNGIGGLIAYFDMVREDIGLIVSRMDNCSLSIIEREEDRELLRQNQLPLIARLRDMRFSAKFGGKKICVGVAGSPEQEFQYAAEGCRKNGWPVVAVQNFILDQALGNSDGVGNGKRISDKELWLNFIENTCKLD
ncbi:MAG: hypothetical protein AB7T49_04135 [Oligoflexales bacterium]